METFNKHINEDLSRFLDSKNPNLFEVVFKKLNSDIKENYRKLLQYIYCILEETRTNQVELKPLNIHFERTIDEEEKTLIVEFLWNYFFWFRHENENLGKPNPILTGRIDNLENCISRDLRLLTPDYMATRADKTRINKKNKETKEKRERNKKALTIYKSLNASSSLSPETLINLKVNQHNSLNKFYEYNPVYLPAGKNNLTDLNSFVLYNTNEFNDVRTLRIDNTPLLQIIKNIVLFDCENLVQRFTPFNFQRLTNLNEHHGTKFSFFLLVTFSNKENLNSIKTKVNRLKERYYIPNQSSYIIKSEEFAYLVGQEHDDKPEINFLEPANSTFWEDFYIETKINDLYELRSIKIMNIFSLCINQKIKDYILTHIFSSNTNRSLITEDTKQEIFSLPNEDILKLKDLLSNVLDLIINTDLKSHIKNNITDDTKIVLDDFILKNEDFLDLIKKSINLRSNRMFISWDNLEENTSNYIIILSYRDQGNFNNHFYPNVNEISIPKNTLMKCFFPALFFKKNFKWSKFNLARDYYKMLDHPIRVNHFNWNRLKEKIQEIKPEKTIDISWDLESDYSSSHNRITYRISFINNRHNTCNPSELHIYYEGDSKQKRIQSIKWIFENLENEEDRVFVQKLDELIEEFNPAEKLIDTKQQENDLNIIRKQLDLGEESAGRLWKILLARKAAISGSEIIYNDLKTIFIKNNLDMVSQGHFESTWINPYSSSLTPRGNKAFKVVCKYLGLPTTYLRIIYTIKNRNINGRRNATRIYSKLLKDLFNDGCFDEGANANQILIPKIDYYKNNHNLDELGIDEEKAFEGIITLIELIKPELSFKEIRNIEKREE
ncbi:hypothetical protein GUB10_08580 [Salegentibacter sp. BLCTC]|uniref:hypothetical protein n=1 Tax=Salegentibacter sp. BLCTC TaxID=2697368 RepID=UPI00187BAB67|nr:hypothetical protein [Salegentibacter sp. BLCTC]MBE7640386.1 hypothetical protein [Salegentibacter sp. BLCTC]